MTSVSVCLLSTLVLAADSPPEPLPDTTPAPPRRLTVLPLPTMDVAPETGFSLGAVALVQARPFAGTRPTQAELELAGTVRRQAVVRAEADVFLPRNTGLVRVEAAWLRFPELYWGVGPNTAASSEEGYDNRRLDVELEPMWRPVGELYVGPSAAVYGMWDVEPDSENTLLVDSVTPGASGGWSVGGGSVALWEGRANRLNPEPQSTYGLVRVLTFQPAWGSDFQFSRLELDGRVYPQVGPLRLAMQGVARLHRGTPPFRQLALQGGDPMGRGLYAGRFRDRQLVGAQVEVRQPVWWRLGGVGFVGASAVAPTVAALGDSPLRPSAGGGLRVRLDDQDNINLRIDVAWAGDGDGGGTGVYAGFGEAF